VSEQPDEHIRALMNHRSTLGSRYRQALAQRMHLAPEEMAAVLHLTRGALTAGQLSHALVLDVDRVRALVADLEDAGHVVRRAHADDPQLVAVGLSDSTRELLAEITRPLVEELDALTRGLTPDERETIGRFLEAVTLLSEQEADRAARAAMESDRDPCRSDGG
jgi:DNA-binding MarR family transcriptional regulator